MEKAKSWQTVCKTIDLHMQVRLITYTHKWYNYLIYKHEWCRCCFKGTFRKLACGINTLFCKMTANYTSYHNKAPINYFAGFPGGSVVKNLPAMRETQEMWVQSLGREDPLEEGMATHSSLLAWRVPWTEEPGGLQSMGHKESDTTETTVRTCSTHIILHGGPQRMAK